MPAPETGGIPVVEIPEGVTVHRSPCGYFRRHGAAKLPMDSDAIRRLSRARGLSGSTSTDPQVIRDAGINSLQPDLWRRYPSSRTTDSANVALTKLRFAKFDANGLLRATVGGALLASDNPREWLPSAYIMAARYPGNRQLEARETGGPPDRQIREAVRFVETYQRVASYQAPHRVEIPQYSVHAVFEAVVNAVAPRDYAAFGTSIRLFMFDDRLELYSPGNLSDSMSPDVRRTNPYHATNFCFRDSDNATWATSPDPVAVSNLSNGGVRAYPSSRMKLLRFAASVPALNRSAVEN